MKARVIKTGEIINVQCLHDVIYSRLDSNSKIAEEYYEDELEIIVEPEVKKSEKEKFLEKFWHSRNDLPKNGKDVLFMFGDFLIKGTVNYEEGDGNYSIEEHDLDGDIYTKSQISCWAYCEDLIPNTLNDFLIAINKK